MNVNAKEFLWTERYRPKRIDDCILPSSIKKIFKQFLNNDELQNLLLTGGAGIGKTTIARILCEQMNCDYLVINGSLEGRNIDTLRTTIYGFASTVSLLQSKFKVIIIDEADFLNPQSVQPALRAFMEEFSSNCRFIFTCNFKNKILEPIHSRCTEVIFNIKKNEKQKLAIEFMERVSGILDEEGIKYDEKVLSQVIVKHFPDFRKVINEIQKYSAGGVIDSGILNTDMNLTVLKKSIQTQDFKTMRKWIAENIDSDPVTLMRKVYDTMYELFQPENIPEAVLIINKHMYQSAFVADQEINLVACFTELMVLVTENV